MYGYGYITQSLSTEVVNSGECGRGPNLLRRYLATIDLVKSNQISLQTLQEALSNVTNDNVNAPNQEINNEIEEEYVQIREYYIDGFPYDYVTLKSANESHDFLANVIKSTNLNNVRVAIACELPDEAAELMKQLGRRSVASLLVNNFNNSINTCVNLWIEGLINSVLIISDDVLQQVGEFRRLNCVNFLIHATPTWLPVLQKRKRLLVPMKCTDIDIWVMMCPDAPKTTNKQTTVIMPSVAAATAAVDTVPIAAVSPAEANAIPENEPKPKTKPTESLTCVANGNTKKGNPYDAFIYNNNGILAWSRKEVILCNKMLEVAAVKQYIKDAMLEKSLANKLQRYAWPHAAAGRSLCVVGNQKVGKTWCYLPSLCQRVAEEALHRDENLDFGPTCIIICANITKGKQIAQNCFNLLVERGQGMKCIDLLFERHDLNVVASRLRKPRGILITNIDLLWQIHDEEGLFNSNAIKCVAFDEINAIWRYGVNCVEVLKWLCTSLCFDESNAQLFVVGRTWNEVMYFLVLEILPDVLLLFEDALEATVFTGVELDLRLVSPINKISNILTLLKEKNLTEERVVIACRDEVHALKLSNDLKYSKIGCIVLCQTDINATFIKWTKERKPNVLIAFDDVISKLTDGKIDCLLHYTISSTWQRFKERFTILYDNYGPQPESSTVTSIIPMSRNEIDQIWYMCDFMFKHGRMPPDNWLSIVTLSRQQLERSKPRDDQPLCCHFMVYGNCFLRNCQNRHVFWDTEIKVNENLPKSGTIRFRVLKTFSPTMLCIRLAKFELHKHFLNIPVTKLGEQIQLHYELAENKICHLYPKAGDLCIVNIEKLYQRVRVTKVDTEKDDIEIKQLDAGTDFYTVRSFELLKCDEKFKHHDFEACDLHITGLTPFNSERVWLEESKRIVRHKFFSRQHGKKGRIFTATVDFQLNSSIFVENIYDEDRNDLKSFMHKQYILLYIDPKVKTRIEKLKQTAKPFPVCVERKQRRRFQGELI